MVSACKKRKEAQLILPEIDAFHLSTLMRKTAGVDVSGIACVSENPGRPEVKLSWACLSWVDSFPNRPALASPFQEPGSPHTTPYRSPVLVE